MASAIGPTLSPRSIEAAEIADLALALYANARFMPAYADRHYRKDQYGSQPPGNGDMLKR